MSEASDMEGSTAGDIHARAAHASEAPPEAPRAVTGRVRRGSWTEPRVRSWWLAAAAVGAVSLYFLASRYYVWRRDVNVIRNGTEVQAYIYAADGYPIPGRRRPPTSVVDLRYEVGGKKYEVQGYLKGRTESFVVQTYVPIRVDPDDPSRWTARTQPESLRVEMLSGLMLLPVAVALGAAAWWRRARLLGLWRNGRSVEAVVMESRQTALAPRSRFVRCAPLEAGDTRVFGVYVPERAGALAEGDRVWVIAAAGGNSSALGALWMR